MVEQGHLLNKTTKQSVSKTILTIASIWFHTGDFSAEGSACLHSSYLKDGLK